MNAGEPARDLLTVLLESARCGIRTYTGICDLTAGKDFRTHNLADAILNEKIEHEAWLKEFLGDGEGGKFHRGFRGRAPYVSHFSGKNTGPGYR